MSHKSYKSYASNSLIPPHGGYKNFEAYKTAAIISDGTSFFCKKWIKDTKQESQINGAARSGKQCTAEGSVNSGTSQKLESKLIGNARGSYQELLEDFCDFLRQRKLKLWKKDSSKGQVVRQLAYKSNRSYTTYDSYIGNKSPEIATNTLICHINQKNFLHDELLRKLEKDFLEKGGVSERFYWKRKEAREK